MRYMTRSSILGLAALALLLVASGCEASRRGGSGQGEGENEGAGEGEGEGGGEGEGEGDIELAGVLQVACDVPFVLDGSKAGDMFYMMSHFGDLVQQYCITGTVSGVDITGFPEKMYYGSHDPVEPVLSLTQASMTDALAPQYTVKVDFLPDSEVSAGAVWPVGVGEGEAMAVLIRHVSLEEMCAMAVGVSGSLTFGTAQGVTQVEGGRFSVSGSLELAAPSQVEGICEAFAGVIPCCP